MLCSFLDYLVEGFKPEGPIPSRRAIAPDVVSQVCEEMVLGPVEACVFRHLVEEIDILQLQVVNALHITHLELMLKGERKELDQLDPRCPCRMCAHRIGEQWVQYCDAVGYVCVV